MWELTDYRVMDYDFEDYDSCRKIEQYHVRNIENKEVHKWIDAHTYSKYKELGLVIGK